MLDYKSEYQKWCQSPYFDEQTRNELCELQDETEIKDRFYRQLEFGTGGLRGVMGAGLNRMNRYIVRKVTQGLANYVIQQEGGEKSAAIAYDSRHCSKEFAMEAALCLCANGIRVYLFDDLRPTPELSFAIRELGCMTGIVITASHNPSEYNGYKVYWSDGAQIISPRDQEILSEVNAVTDFEAVKSISQEEAEKSGLLTFIGAEMDRRYINALKGLIQEPEVLKAGAGQFKVVYTPLHGTGNIPVRSMLKEMGIENVYIVKEQEQPDGAFPTVTSPNPEDSAAFTMALALAKEVDADLVLATDPDADRLGVYARSGKTGEYMPLNGNMTGTILCEYLLSRRKEKQTLPKNGAVVTTIVSGKMVDAVCCDYGAAVIRTLTGFKYIGEQIQRFEEDHSYEYLFGFEESYGCLIGTNSRDKDAVVAVAALCEAAIYYQLKGLTLWDQMEQLYEKYGYFEESLHTMTMLGMDGVAKISAIMEDMRKHPLDSIAGKKTVEVYDYKVDRKIRLTDGSSEKTGLPQSDVLYYVLEDESFVCIRPSGTEPKVKFYMGTKRASETEAKEQLSRMWQELECKMKMC